jgi:putative transposase
MEKEHQSLRPHERWAHFRFSVIGPLLAAPPARGELQHQLKELAAKKWRHPITSQWIPLGRSTIERWYYKALRAKDGPVDILKRKIRSDQGAHPALNSKLVEALTAQYRQHPSWSYQLHYDNLAVLAQQQPELGPMPAYVSVLRFMKSHGLFKRPRRGPVHSPGAQAAEQRYEAREIRSYESHYVNALWHLDFHHGSRRVLLPAGQWAYPLLLAISDDRSRLCCHAQWYLAEGAEDLCHGLCQAFQKRSLPRALMTDNGSAMLAAEIQQGLTRLSILCEHTLPFSPYYVASLVMWPERERPSVHRASGPIHAT